MGIANIKKNNNNPEAKTQKLEMVGQTKILLKNNGGNHLLNRVAITEPVLLTNYSFLVVFVNVIYLILSV